MTLKEKARDLMYWFLNEGILSTSNTINKTAMRNQILEILEIGIKDDGKSFFSTEEKLELLTMLFDEESKKTFDRGWQVGYDRGVKDAQTPSGW